MTIARIITGSVISASPCIIDVINDTAAAERSIIIIKSLNCSRNFINMFFFFFSISSFLP